mmetsp:Transcript_30716/g.94060  ORF Transcript_30716/g.94060 Transcript_30716/m.94060 type:complete len:90 (-) Transcript_30716:1206-1475(-)
MLVCLEAGAALATRHARRLHQSVSLQRLFRRHAMEKIHPVAGVPSCSAFAVLAEHNTDGSVLPRACLRVRGCVCPVSIISDMRCTRPPD